MTLKPPVLIEKSHQTLAFDCGVAPLNTYLKKHALQSSQSDSTRTYVALRTDIEIVGYYTLTATSASRDDMPERIVKGLGNHSVPLILIARLAVDMTERRKGLGAGLLKHALLNCVRGADVIGARAVIVHAKDATAKEFYLKYDFVPSPTNDLHLLLLMKDIRKNLGLKETTHAAP